MEPEVTAPSVPTCYRHPDRETYVRCTRCERPICPDCMHSASVGFHCPDCVREGSRSQRPLRTVFGGRVRGDAAMVTRTLIVINVVMFLLQHAVPGLESRLLLNVGAVASGEYYRLLTAAFLHGGVAHIFFNMYLLLLIGSQLEAALGRWRFTTLYLVSALGGSAASYLFNPLGYSALGASGAVFGLFGALYVVSRRLGTDVTGITWLIVLNLALGFIVKGIDWRAHVGGLLTGAVLAAAYAYAPRSLRLPSQVGVSLAVVGVLTLAVVVRTTTLVG
jgi:membrane associated rhomboid family serine protease